MFILKALWFFLPGGLANMAPVIFKKINFLDYPIDFGKQINGKPILGSHKTFRGYFFGILLALIGAWVQKLLFVQFDFIKDITILPYDELSPWLIGFLMGFGALFGDSVKSFLKRQVEIKAGDKFIPWDQIDFIIGFLLFTSILYIPPASIVLSIILAVPLLHILVNYLGYYIKLQDSPW